MTVREGALSDSRDRFQFVKQQRKSWYLGTLNVIDIIKRKAKIGALLNRSNGYLATFASAASLEADQLWLSEDAL